MLRYKDKLFAEAGKMLCTHEGAAPKPEDNRDTRRSWGSVGVRQVLRVQLCIELFPFTCGF
jgi:hypothetical protein